MRFEEAIARLSEEAQEKIKDCKTVEEILSFFKQNNIDISLDDINKTFITKSGELSDDELENVTGGNIIQDILQGILGHFAKQLLNDQNTK